ncbi:MAG: phosphotransferase [Desulfotomaculaceae bacterium]|nr:phosphotransferase [Desulfotomaculaceae bacterium]
MTIQPSWLPLISLTFSYSSIDDKVVVVYSYNRNRNPLTMSYSKGGFHMQCPGIIYQLLLILNALHNPRHRQDAVVHRDLRLSNLMLSGDNLYLIDFGLARFIDSQQFPCCPDPLQKKFKFNLNDKERFSTFSSVPVAKHIPGPGTYQLLRREISPLSDLFGVGVVAMDLFTNWIEDEALLNKSWEQVLPLSEPFKVFAKKLLSREGFTSSAEALGYLYSLAPRA